VKQNTKKDAPLYSQPIRVTVNTATGTVEIDERAQQAAESHKRLVASALSVERRLHRLDKPPGTQPGKPPGADEVLAELAEAFEPGETITTRDIMRWAGVVKGTAVAVRLWATRAGCWPYVMSRGGYGPRRKGGGE
jgi:hypothetical protein